MPLMRINNVSHSYPAEETAVLRNVDISFDKGEMAGVIGPNGAGKSTLLKIMGGFLVPASGSVEIGGVRVDAMPRGERARLIAVVPQNVFTPMPYTVREVVEMGRAVRIPKLLPMKAEDREAVEEAMRDMDIASLADRPFNMLSGGERQRVVLAAAVARKPSILFLDEPTSQLDLGHATRFMRFLSFLREERNVTIVAVSHDVQLLSCFFPRLVALKNGAVVADGSPSSVVTAEMVVDVYGCQAKTMSLGSSVAILPI